MGQIAKTCFTNRIIVTFGDSFQTRLPVLCTYETGIDYARPIERKANDVTSIRKRRDNYLIIVPMDYDILANDEALRKSLFARLKI